MVSPEGCRGALREQDEQGEPSALCGFSVFSAVGACGVSSVVVLICVSLHGIAAVCTSSGAPAPPPLQVCIFATCLAATVCVQHQYQQTSIQYAVGVKLTPITDRNSFWISRMSPCLEMPVSALRIVPLPDRGFLENNRARPESPLLECNKSDCTAYDAACVEGASRLATMYLRAEVDHVAMRAADALALTRFYVDVLGFEPVRVAEFERGEVGFPSVRVSDGCILDFMQGGGGGGNANHLCFSLEKAKFDEVMGRVKGAGVVPEGEPRLMSGARGQGWGVYIKDPEGNQLELRWYE